ncbi:MAG: hypothetical protein M3P96_06715, partial [Actinomycetota bacterium]|nr:hypothetical protein [Actinomycetota bacterium]
MLAELAPGPELLAALLAVEPAHRDPASRIDAIAGWERMAAWVAGRQVGELAEFARAHPAPAPGGSRDSTRSRGRWPSSRPRRSPPR